VANREAAAPKDMSRAQWWCVKERGLVLCFSLAGVKILSSVFASCI
jgi:hypothetical protein